MRVNEQYDIRLKGQYAIRLKGQYLMGFNGNIFWDVIDKLYDILWTIYMLWDKMDNILQDLIDNNYVMGFN